MEKSVKSRLIRGLSANGSGRLITAFIQLISVPLFLYVWGVELYGEWLLLSAIPAYFAISDLGFANVGGNEMVMSEASGDRRRTITIFQSVWAFVCMVCALVFLVLVFLIFFQLHAFFDFNIIKGSAFSAVIMLLTLSVLVSLQTGLLMQGYRAAEKYARGEWLQNLVKLLEFAALAAGLLIGCDAVALALIILGSQTMGFLMIRLDLKRSVPWLRYGFINVSIPLIRRLLKPSLMFMGFPFGHAIWQQGTLMVVASVLGPSAVVPFSAVRTITNVMQQGTGVINAAFWPELSRAIGKQDMALASELYRVVMKATFWSASIFGLVLAAAGTDIIALWTLNKVNGDLLFVCLMVGAVWFRCFWSASSVVLLASNAHSKTAGIYVASSFLAVISSFFTASEFGLFGVAIVLIAVELAIATYIFSHTNRFLAVSGWSICRRILSRK